MDLMIDANVAIDFLTNREPFAESAEQVIVLCATGKANGMLSAGEVTTIFYVLRKQQGADKALAQIRTVLKYLDIVDTTRADVKKALDSNMPDFEDAVIAQSAKRVKTNFIITRDTRDFKGSPVPAISPADFLKSHKPE